MSWDTGLADRIRAKGVPVVEVAGWSTRGSTTHQALAGVWHHTAGAATGATPSLAVCIYGRSDVPGPLCQVLQSRDPDGNDKAYVIAAGRANHAGAGSWRGVSGNSRSSGVEVEHTGTGTVDERRHEVTARILAALLEAPGGSRDARLVCRHQEWAPDRKIDFRDPAPWSGDRMRSRVAYWIGRTAEEDDDMTPEQEQKLDRILAQLDTNNDSGFSARTLASLRRIENDHRRQVLAAVEGVRSAVVALLAPFGTEWVDRSGNKGSQGAPGFKETTPLQRWVIEGTKVLRRLDPRTQEPPEEP